MRPQLPTLRSPLTVMQLASEMGRLYDIEKLTFFRACECYEELELPVNWTPTLSSSSTASPVSA
mgnify:FL=1